jgi:hypothetical protein
MLPHFVCIRKRDVNNDSLQVGTIKIRLIDLNFTQNMKHTDWKFTICLGLIKDEEAGNCSSEHFCFVNKINPFHSNETINPDSNVRTSLQFP